MSAVVNNKAAQAPLRDRMIPWYFVMAFGVVFAVNMVFVWLAIENHQGVVTKNPYEKGLAYNDTLAQMRKQAALGWQTELLQHGDVLQLVLKDKDGAPLAGAQVNALIERPIERDVSHQLMLKETRPGQYEAVLELPASGQWDVTVSSIWKQQYHQTRTRLVIQ